MALNRKQENMSGHIRMYPILKHLFTFSLIYYAAKQCIVVFTVKTWHVRKGIKISL